jgi:hypothetical protein
MAAELRGEPRLTLIEAMVDDLVMDLRAGRRRRDARRRCSRRPPGRGRARDRHARHVHERRDVTAARAR